MKLHLPVKLRASLIAAVIAVSASVYNARAIDYVAPSADYGWNTNNITLTERYTRSAGNTYTATSTDYVVYDTYDAYPKVRVGYAVVDGAVVELEYDGARYSYDGQAMTPEAYSTTPDGGSKVYVGKTNDHEYVLSDDGSALVEKMVDGQPVVAPKKTDPARVLIETTALTDGSKISFLQGDTTITTNDTLVINNSVSSGVENLQEDDLAYQGNLNIVTNAIDINKDSQNQGSTVVLEDVNISAYSKGDDATPISTDIDEDSRLVILNGDTDHLGDQEKALLDLTGVESAVDVTEQKTVDLGNVTGKGSLTVLGNKERTKSGHEDVAEDSPEGTVGKLVPGYNNGAVGKDDGVTVTIDHIGNSDGTTEFGEVNIANADVVITEGIDKATTVTLVNSVTTAENGGVSARGFDVNGESVLTANNDITNMANQGSGHVDISGKVESTEGSIALSNGQKEEGFGVNEGATLIAEKNITLSNVDATATEEINAKTGDLFLTADSSLTDAHNVNVGNDLIVEAKSDVLGSEINVKGDVVVTDQSTGSDPTAPGASTITDSRVTVTPKGTSNVEISGGSSMTDSLIIGANGDILISSENPAEPTTVTGTKGTTNFISSFDEVGNVVDKKGNLNAILAAAKGDGTEGNTGTSPLTEAAINESGSKVTSMIGNTTGNVTVVNSDVKGTVLTGGGDVTVGDRSQATSDANQAALDEIRGQLPNIEYAASGDKFDTFVDGSIIDVRGNLDANPKPENDLVVGAGAITNTIILGITGNIVVDGSLLANDYIDGGKGLEIDNGSIIVDTDIVNLEADIKISGNATIVSTDSDKPFVLNTKGTYGEKDKDSYTGGSIILDGTTLENGTIKSGVEAVRQADGSYVFNPLTSETEAEQVVWNESAGAWERTGLGVNLPYGEINVKNSTLKGMEVTTVAGDIELQGNAVPLEATAAHATAGRASTSRKAIQTSLAKLAGEATTFDTLKSLTITERNSGAHGGTVYLQISKADGTLVAKSSNTQTFGTNNAQRTFNFGPDGVKLDPNEVYNLRFVNEAGTEVSVGFATTAGGDHYAKLQDYDFSAVVSAELTYQRDNPLAYSNTILGSTITTGNGALNAVLTYMDSRTEGEGDEAKYVKNTIAATKDSVINSSYANGTDIAIKDAPEDSKPSLTVYNTILRGDTNLDVDGWVTVDGRSDVALDGYRHSDTAKDAGIVADVLRFEVLKDDTASLANSKIDIKTATLLRDRPSIDGHVNTLNLSNTEGNIGNLYDELDFAADADQDRYGNATVNITDGSSITAKGISAGHIDATQAPVGATDTTAKKSYFGNINVEGDSSLTVKETAIIKNYRENVGAGEDPNQYKFAGADTNGSTVVFEKDAWLTDAHIIGMNVKPTGEFGVKATENLTRTSINGAAHIGNLRLDREGVLNLVNKATDGAHETVSYIANIKPGYDDTPGYVGNEKGSPHGTINVVNETLVTPVLNSEWLSLGLNGATVELGEVTADQGATVAGGAVNPHVTLREITNGVIAGAPAVDKTPVGSSTIKTTLNRLTEASSSSMGEAVTKTANVYHYVVMHDVRLEDGTELHAGDIVSKSDLAAVTEEIPLLGEVVTGVTPVDAVTLTPEEQTYLTRITNPVPVLGENGQQLVDEMGRPVWEVAVDEEGNTLTIVGQLTTTQEIETHPDATGTLGSMVEKTDGIASLTVKGSFDADNTAIKAYQTASSVVVDADAGVSKIVADENTGFITIEGKLTGQDNTLTADTDISVGGIVADGGASYSNRNALISIKGDIAVGEAGIIGSDNGVSAREGSVNVAGSLAGDHNQIYGKESVAIQDGILGALIPAGEEGGEPTIDPSDANNITTHGDITIGQTEGKSIVGNSNVLFSAVEGDIEIDGETEGNANYATATLGDITSGNITGNENRFVAAQGDVTTGDVTGNSNNLWAGYYSTVGGELEEIGGGNVTTGDIVGNSNNVVALEVEDVENSGNTVTGDVVGNDNTIAGYASATVNSLQGDRNFVISKGDITVTESIGLNPDGETSDNNEIVSTEGNVVIGAVGVEGGYDPTSVYGDNNVITAEAGNVNLAGDLRGNGNALSGVNVLLDQTEADIIGNSNQLTATESITTATIQGDDNVLTAGTSIATGDIAGNRNELTAGTDITVDGGITGDENELTAGTNVTIAGTVDGAGNIIDAVAGTITINGNIIGEDAGNANELTAGQTINIEGTLGGTGTQVLAYGNGLSQDDVAITVGVFAAQGTDLGIATTSDPVFGTTNGNGSIVIGAMGAAVDKDGNAVDVDKTLVNNIVSNNSYVSIGALNGSNAVTKVTAAKDIIIGTSTLHAEDGDAPADTASNLTLSGANIVLNRPNGLVLTDSVISTPGSITGTSLTLTTSGDTRFTSTAANVTLTDLEIAGYAVLNASGAVNLQTLTINGRNAALISSDVSVRDTLTLKNGAVFDIARLTVDSIIISDSTLTTSGALSLDGTLHAAIGTEEGDLKSGSNINVQGPLSVGELKADSQSVISALSIAATQNDIEGVGTTSGDIIADGGTIKATAGDVQAAGAITVDNGGTIMGTNVRAAGDITVGSKKGNTVTGGSLTANGGTISGASLEAHSATISATQGISLNGALTASDRTEITGSVTQATNVTVEGDSAIHGSVSSMTGALMLDNGRVDGSVTGATRATLTNGSSVGALTMSGTDADITATDSTIGGDITDADDVTLTNTDAKNITLTGKLTASGGTVGNISNAKGVELTNVTTGNITGLTGALKATGSTIGDLTQADGTELDSVTLKDTTIQNEATITSQGVISMVGSSVGGSVISTGRDAGIKAENSTIGGAVSAAGNATLTHVNVTAAGEDGVAVKGSSVTISEGSNIAGAVTATNGAASITGSTTGAVAATNGKATITGSTTGAVTSTGTGAGVEATNSTIGGTVSTSGAATLTDVDVTAAGEDGVAVKGSSVTISEGSDIAGAVTATNGAASITGSTTGAVTATNGKATITGSTTGAVTSTGTDAGVEATNSTIGGAVSTTGAATLTDVDVTAAGEDGVAVKGSSVTISEGSNIAGSVKATSGNVTITGSITGAVTAAQEAIISNGATTGDVKAASATLTNSTVGAVATTGALTTNGDVIAKGDVQVGSTLTVNQGTLNAGKKSVTVTGKTILNEGEVKAGAFVTGSLETGNVSGAVDSLTSHGDAVLNGGSLETGSITVDKGGTLTLGNGAAVSSTGASTVAGLTTVKENSSLTGTALDTTGLTVTGDSLVAMAGDGTEGPSIDLNKAALTVTGSTVNGSIGNANGVTVTESGHVNGSIAMSGGDLTVTDSDVDNVTGAVDATLTNAETGDIGMTGFLTATNATTGAITGTLTGATVTGGSVIGSGLTASGVIGVSGHSTVKGSIKSTGDTVTVSDSTIEGDATGTTTTVKGGSVTGSIAATAGNATVTGVEVGGNVTGQAGATVTGGSVAGSVTAKTGNATVTDVQVGGNVAASQGLAAVNGGSVTGTVTGQTVDADNTTIGLGITGTDAVDVTETTVLAGGVTGGTTTVENSTIAGNVAATTGTVTVTGGSVTGYVTETGVEVSGSVTGQTGATVTGATVTGSVTAKTGDATVTNADVDGSVVADLGKATVNGGTVDGSVSGQTVKLTETTVGTDVTATDSLTSNGDVLVGGNVTVGTDAKDGTLTVNNGTLSATNVTVHGETKLNNGTVDVSGTFTTDSLTTTELNGTIGGLVVEDDINLSGGSLTVTGAVSGESLTLDGQQLDAAGQTVTVDTTATLKNGSNLTAGSLTVNNGGKLTGEDVGLDVNGSTATVTGEVDLNGTDLVVDNGGAVTAGSIAEAGDVTVTDSSINGSLGMNGALSVTNGSVDNVTGATSATISGSSTGSIGMNGTDSNITATDSTIGGNVTGAKNVTLTDTKAKDIAMNGKLTADHATTGTISGTVTEAKISNGSTINSGITSTGDITVKDSEVTGLVKGVTINVTDSTVGSVDAKNATLTNSTVNGSITTKQDLTTIGDVIAQGKVTVGNNLMVNEGTLNAGENAVAVTGSITLNNGQVKAGAVTSGKATVTDGSTLTSDTLAASEGLEVTDMGTVKMTESIDLNNAGLTVANSTVTAPKVTQAGTVKATDGATINGNVSGATGVTVADSAINGSVGMNGALSVTKGSVGNVTGATSATISDNSTTGDLTMDETKGGSVTVTGDSVVGNISHATSATITGSSTGSIDMTGDNADLTATDSTIGDVTGADDVTLDNTSAKNLTAQGTTTIEGNVSATSVDTKGLAISTRSALNAKDDVAADGLVKIDGSLKSDGAVDLTGMEGSSITGTVAAAKDVTLNGTLSATGADIGGANVNVKGTVTAGKSTLTGENIAVDGTLHAGKGTVLDGAVSGTGTINKTGGDTLALGGDTDMAGGKVNISDASTVDAADGAHLGTVTVGKGSTLELAGKNATGTVKADGLKLAEGANLNADIELGKGNDKVAGTVDMGGNSLNLNSISAEGEKNIADGTVVKVFDGTVTNVNEDVVHNLGTLNAHMEQNGDVVLSKNYKSAGETENQTQTASALTSIKQSTLHADSELNAVFDALNHTRSAEEARAALDSLGGAGLGGLQKAVADDAAEHLQTLRSTLQSLAANVNRKYDAAGRSIEGVTSSSISGSVTGGTSQVKGNGNSGKYDRNSIGFMLAGTHAVTEDWTFGGDLSMSFMDATCDTTDIDGTAIYADVALLYNGARFHQMGTLGFGLFDFDTERRVGIESKGHTYGGTAKGSTQAMTVNLSYQGIYDLIQSDEGHVLSTVVIGEGTFGQIDAMTEDGMGDAGLRSEFDDVASLTFAAGLRYTYEFGAKTNPGYFAAEALFVASAGDTMPKVNNMFIGGGNGFEVAGPETGNTGVRLNAGALVPLSEQWGVFGNVTSEFRSKQSTVGGSVGVKYSF